MKKLTFTFILLGLYISTAQARASYIARTDTNKYDVTYNYTDKQKNGWYTTVRAELNLLNWTNTYNSDYVGFSEDEKFSNKATFGGSVTVGKKFGYFWRGELEAGYTGNFKDANAGVEFNLSAPYLMANGLYDFSNGVYLGAGLGVAMPITTLDSDIFLDGGRKETGISPMAGLMVGFTKKLDDNFVLDLRYRLAGFNGTKNTRNFEDTSNNQFYLETKMGLILENSLSVALRYEF